VYLSGGEILPYDYLILAAGAVKGYDAIPGYREYGYSFCDDVEAQRLQKRLESFEGGRILLGIAPSRFGRGDEAPSLMTPWEGPLLELAFLLDRLLRERGIRERSSIGIFTPADRIPESVGAGAQTPIGERLSQREIRVYSAKKIRALGTGGAECEDGSVLEGDLLILIPPYEAPAFVEASGLGDGAGWIPTDPRMRHPRYPEIYAAGDLNALALPRMGYLAVHQADVAVSSILESEGLVSEGLEYRPGVFSVLDLGGAEGMLIYSDLLYGGSHDLAWESALAKLMKMGFDAEYRFTHGHLPPEKVMESLESILRQLSEHNR